MIIKRIKCPGFEHLSLIKDCGELRIANLSLYHYHCEEFDIDNSILLESRINGFLVGISFVSLIDSCDKYSITVVHKDFRSRGIGTLLLSIKKKALNKHGYLLKTTVGKENIASIKMCSKIFQRKEVKKCTDKVIFY